jgi:hypothetical protein
MRAFNRKITRIVSILALGASLSPFGAALAETDKEMAEKALKAREQGHGEAMDHSAHGGGAAEAPFRGVFYGYLPCHEPECSGLKMTLSLNPKNRYLLVIQPAKPQNRESFEKGRYEWDDSERIVVLTPNQKAPQRRLAIEDDGTLLYLSGDGASLSGDRDKYLLKRSDTAGNREMHIH